MQFLKWKSHPAEKGLMMMAHFTRDHLLPGNVNDFGFGQLIIMISQMGPGVVKLVLNHLEWVKVF